MPKKSSTATKIVKPERKKAQKVPSASARKPDRGNKSIQSKYKLPTIKQQLAQRNAELAIISSVAEAASSIMDTRMILEKAAREIVDSLNARSCGVALLNDAQTELRVIAFAGRAGEPSTEGTVLQVEGNIATQQAIQSRQSVVITDAPNTPLQNEATREIMRKRGTQCLLITPLLARGRVIGTFGTDTNEPGRAFSPEQVNLAETIASHIASAIENARLFEETRRAREVADILRTANVALTKSLDLDTILEALLDYLQRLIPYDSATIFLMEGETNLAARAVRGYERFVDPALARAVVIEWKTLPRIKQVLVRQTSWMIPDTTTDPTWSWVPTSMHIRNWLAIPLVIGEKTIGLFSLDKTEPNYFTEEHRRQAEALAAQAAIAIQNAHLFAETQRHFRETEVLRAANVALTKTFDLDTILNALLDNLQQLVPYDTGSVFLLEDEMRLTARAACGYEKWAENPAQATNISFDFKELPHIRTVVEDQRTFVIPDVTQYPEWVVTETGRHIRNWLAVPLVVGGKTLGMYSLDKVEPGYFTPEHQRLAENLATQAAIAIQNARLFRNQQVAREQAETLRAVTQALSRTLNLQEVFDLILAELHKVVPYDSSSIQQLEGEYSIIVGGRGFPNLDELLGLRFPVTSGDLSSNVYSTRRPYIVEDVSASFPHFRSSAHGSGRIHGWLGVPLMFGDRLIGMLTLDKYERSFYKPEHAQLAMAFAAQAANAIENARLFNEAQESRAVAEQANASKSIFLANMSHELRTPLNAIIGFTRIVRRKAEGVLPEKQTDNLDKVLASAEHLLGLINTVLDIAKIEAGRMDVLAANFRIQTLIDLCANTTQPLLRPNVVLEKQVDESLSMVHSDQDKIRQIVLNLLSNAAKFTHEGRIIIAANRDDENLRVSVSDTGIGISEEALPRIFKEFQQADNTTTRQYGGTGLGLAISRNLAHLLGGDLTVESELGKGSTFILTIPIQYGGKSVSNESREPVPAQPSDRSARIDTTKKLVLVIDDDPDAVYLLQENLGQKQFDIIGSRSGQDGLRLAREQQPQAILLDVLMPETDGWQILHALKTDPLTANIPVILLTIVDKKALGFHLGASAYLLKPLNPVAVRDALNRVIKNDPGQKHILIVDDDPAVADMLRQFLPESSFRLESASDGAAGLEAIEAQRPDVVLLDLLMPRLDGFGVIEKLRANPETHDLPIIVISVKELTNEEARKLKESVTFVMKKQGFDGVKLIQEIDKALHSTLQERM